jgi:tetratricopeptide (TPR) repeat protein
VSALLASCSFVVARHSRAIEHGERALTIAAASGDLTLQLQANFFLGQANFGLGAYHRARDSFTKNLDPPPADLIGIMYSILSGAWVAWSLAELGELPQGLARAEEALKAADALGDHFCLINALASVGIVRLWKGELAEAIPPLERGLARSQGSRNQTAVVLIGAFSGHAHALAGRLDEALSLLEQSVKQGEKGMGYGYSLSVSLLGQAYLQS